MTIGIEKIPESFMRAYATRPWRMTNDPHIGRAHD